MKILDVKLEELNFVVCSIYHNETQSGDISYGRLSAGVRWLMENGRVERRAIILTEQEHAEIRALFEKISARVKGEA